MSEFTKELLVYWSWTQPLAAFALSQMERAENAEATVKDYLTVQAELDASETAAKMYAARTLAAEDRQKNAEAERDRLKVELGEAEEAIRDLTDSGDAMRFSMPTAAMAGKAGWDASRRHAAVRRARERGGR